MTWSELTVLVSALLLLVGWVIWVAANRLDRLHRKVASSWSALDDQLVRRASVAAELAAGGLLDPVSSVLVGEAAFAALDARGEPQTARGVERDRTESELSRTVRAALADDDEVAELSAIPVGGELVDALAAAWYRVQLARRFHNEAVAQTQRVRRKWLVRALRLHGHAPMPQTVEIDDEWPVGLARAGQGGDPGR